MIDIARKIAVIFAVAALSPIHSAFAGGKEGGGGNARVCFYDQSTAENVRAQGRIVADEYLHDVREVKLLDVYDSEVLHPIGQVVAARPGESPFQYYDRISDRFMVIPPVRQALQSFKSDTIREDRFVFVSRPLSRVMDVNDIISYEDDPSCVVTTMAVQAFDEDSNATLVTVDGRLFKLADQTNQDAVILHERIYFAFRGLGETDSENARYVVKLLISSNSWTVRQWYNAAARFFSSVTGNDPGIFTYDGRCGIDVFAPTCSLEIAGRAIQDALEGSISDPQSSLASIDAMIEENLAVVPDMSAMQSARVIELLEDGVKRIIGMTDHGKRRDALSVLFGIADGATPADGPID